MQVSIIQIGNSKGIRLNKTLLEKYSISDKIELIMQDDCIVLRPILKPRSDWEEAFKHMHQNGDDKLIIDSFFEDENWD